MPHHIKPKITVTCVSESQSRGIRRISYFRRIIDKNFYEATCIINRLANSIRQNSS